MIPSSGTNDECPERQLPFLAGLPPDATLGDLRLDNVRISVDDKAEAVKRLFEERKELSGVLVVRDGALEGVISRDMFHRHMTRPFYPEIFTHRPVRLLLDIARVEPLRMPHSMSVQQAAHRVLQLSAQSASEPVVVELDDGDFRLLSVNVLLLSQSRLLELANDTIRRQKDAADSANESKSRFLANMSHEIRTPMNGIIGLTDLLLETETDDEKRQYLGMVKSSADWLMTVIDDILDFSKIEAGRLELDLHEFSLRETLGEMLKPLALRAHGKRLELVCHIRSDVPDRLLGDAARLRQVLINLIGNALKFTERGEIVLCVARESRSADAAVLQFSVQDTGVGVPAEKQGRIFRAFEQADNSTSRRFGGTGLGLSISAKLVDMMQGRIWLDSQAGHGSTFHFTACFGCQPEVAAVEIPREIASLRVLLIDDHATARLAVTEMLESWGLTVEAVDSGRLGMAALQSAAAADRSFDVAVIDAALADVPGPDLSRRIKQDPLLAATEVIVLTTGVRVGEWLENKRAGVTASVSKPVTPSELYNALLQTVGLAAAGDEEADVDGLPAQRAWGLRVLLAEDNPVNQTLAVLLLQKRGHDVTVVGNGRAAVDRLQRETFDLVLMDVQMPVMDGFEATQRIRARESGGPRRTPIIAMTAHALKGDRQRCLEAGMDGYVAKPIAAKQLYQAVEDVLAPASLPAPPETPGQETAGLPSPAPASGVVDWSKALAQAGGDAHVLRRIIEVFLEDEQDCRRRIVAALAAGDAAEVRRNAHCLKGTLGLFGADQAQEVAYQLELLGNSGALDRAGEVFAELETQVRQVTPELENYLRQPPGPHRPPRRPSGLAATGAFEVAGLHAK